MGTTITKKLATPDTPTKIFFRECACKDDIKKIACLNQPNYRRYTYLPIQKR